MKGKEHISEKVELASYKILDTLPEKEYDDIAGIASQICKTPISLISFLDTERQFFKAHHGLDIQETPIDQSFCLHAVKSKEEILIVEDARKDPWFSDNPLVKGGPGIVFYAGVPLFTVSGNALGTLCVIDTKPRKLNEAQKTSLKVLADQVIKLLELRKKQYELEETKKILQKEKDRLNSIIEATQVGTFEWDLETDEVRINRRWAEIVGYTLEELLPVTMDTWYKLIHPDDVAYSDAALKDCFDKKAEFYNVEIRMIHKEGHEIWINDRGRVVKWSGDGKPLLMSGTHTDITYRKNTEIQFKTINDNIPGVVYRYRLYEGGRDELQLVSNGANFLWGISSEAAMKNNQLVWERYHKDDLEDHRASIKKSAESLSYWTHEWRYLHPDGSERWHKGTGFPKKMEDGSTVWDSVILDITERKLVEKELQLSEQRFRSLVQNGSDLIAILDLESNYQYVSPTSATILGIPPEDFIGKNAFDFIHPDDKASVLSYLSRLESSPRISVPPFRFKHQDGTWRWIETVVTNMMDDPSIKGIVANSRDITQKINSERKLEQSEKRFKALVQQGADLTAILNLEGEYIYVSPNFPQIVGFSENELIGKKASEFFHPDDLRKIELEFQEMAIKKKIKSSSYRFKNKSGGWRWLQSVATNLLEAEAVRGIVINSVEITELIEAQDKLKTSEARYRGFYESQTNFVIRTDLQGNYSYVNKKFIEDFGWIYPDGKIIGKNCMPSICEYEHQRVIEVVEKCMANPEKVYKIEIDKPRKGGGTVTTLWDFICMVDMTGIPQEIQCMGIDISDRIKFERALQKSNERYEKISEATNDAIWDFDAENNRLIWGKGFTSLFGYDLEKIKPDFDFLLSLIHPEDRERVGQKIGEFMESTTMTNWFEEYRFLMADGYYAFVMDRAVFIRNNEGKVTRVVGAMTDISYRKEYEESLHALNEQLEQHARELEISNKELEQFAYVASHDLQEPLRMVSSFIGLLERKYGNVLDEKAHQYINYAVGGAKRMRQIILDLLEYSRVGKSEEGLKIIALDEVLDEVCLLQRKRIAEKGATIEYGDLPTLITYRAPMMQIFQNLIENSLRYSRDDQAPVIQISSQLKDNEWLFAVQDNGIGIDPQFHDKIFIIFQSLHNKEKFGGTGMGLAIVKKIIENMGGRIWLNSEEGKGTTFYFTLPRAALKPEKDLPERSHRHLK